MLCISGGRQLIVIILARQIFTTGYSNFRARCIHCARDSIRLETESTESVKKSFVSDRQTYDVTDLR
jgi:hypothetical protein